MSSFPQKMFILQILKGNSEHTWVQMVTTVTHDHQGILGVLWGPVPGSVHGWMYSSQLKSWEVLKICWNSFLISHLHVMILRFDLTKFSNRLLSPFSFLWPKQGLKNEQDQINQHCEVIIISEEHRHTNKTMTQGTILSNKIKAEQSKEADELSAQTQPPLPEHLHFLFTMNGYFHHCSQDDLQRNSKPK